MSIYPSLHDRLKNQHEAIAQIISNKEQDFLESKIIAGKWSIKQQIVHLATYQPVFLGRMQSIVDEDVPAFDPYVADLDPQFLQWQNWDMNRLIATMDADRKKIYQFITTLPDEQLNRTGNHKKYGKLNISQWTEFFILHEAHHMFSIFQLAAQAN